MNRKSFTYNDESRQDATAFVSLGPESFPYLADHGFHGMIVLPGTALIDQALRLHTDSYGSASAAVRRIEFLRPVILGERDATLAVEEEESDLAVRYVFREKNGGGTDAATEPVCATLEIVAGAGSDEGQATTPVDPDAFMRHATDLGGPEAFYGRLRENGNQYGPAFQALRRVWRREQVALGRLRLPLRASVAVRHQLDPVLLDGAAQLLAGFFLDQDRTFILQGIEELELPAPAFPEELWLEASLRSEAPAADGSWLGDVMAFDDSGLCLLHARGVRFTHVDRPEAAPAAAAPASVVVAATFTAEPVEDSLRFWADQVGLPLAVAFAPYNQVFQELLHPDSRFRRNGDGVNVILLNLADWADARPAEFRLNPNTAAFGNLARHTLPNGTEVAHLNRHETEYVYREIFEDQCYLRHGIQLPATATVIDIGANIGLFSLFVRSRAPQASVYSFEPSPVAFRALQANCRSYGPQLHAFNVGVADRRGSAALTFYGKSSVFSGFHPDAEEDRQAIRAVVANMVRDELKAGDDSVDEYVDDLMADRLGHQTFECPLVSVSDIIRENNLGRIDLLKIDAEKSELEILRGIADEHWPLIDQVVVEVHDRTRHAVGEVRDILGRQGFLCTIAEEDLLTGSGLFNVYARRSAALAGPLQPREEIETGLRTKADQFIDALEAHTRAASTPTILCVCPPKAGASEASPRWQGIESDLVRRAAALPQVQVVASADILARYGAAGFHEADADGLGHVPYTPRGFAAIGTGVFRVLAALRRPPYKVVVLDCDNTLWQGACGEEGAGVTVTPSHRALQEFMVRQVAAGLLVCLASKNAGPDVWEVFARTPGMVLRREHLAGWRINWLPKSENLRALAAELGLGLDSFIFLDDNPVECAEVRAHCPEVLALELPADPARIAPFLEQVWAFDRPRVTDEDRTRTTKVQENRRRESFRTKVATLGDFIDGLELTVDIFEPGRDQLDRVAQLTQRTNQFNFTAVRRSAGEVARHLAAGGRWLAVTVRDRFGDYGMVGLAGYDLLPDRLRVDTLLLSCRVLGRGVEHRVLAELGRRARADGRALVEVTYYPNAKNEPAGEFIRSVGLEFMRPQAEGGAVFELPAEWLAGLAYDPDRVGSAAGPVDRSVAPFPAPTPAAGTRVRENFQHIAGELGDAPAIGAAVEQFRLRGRGFAAGAAAEIPATPEGRMLELWRRIIGNPRIGPHDNFFDAGGTSLKAVQAIAAIRRELGLPLSIVDLFARPTVGLLCAGQGPGAIAAGGGSDAAQERGARRKQHGARRRNRQPGAALMTA